MDKKIFLVLLLLLTLATATWTYKGQNFADNQILVYITGSQLLAPGQVEQFDAGPIPALRSGETIDVPVDGITTPCKLSAFDHKATASGNIKSGRLQNGVQLQEGNYIELKDDTKINSKNWGTNEVVNSLEVGGCAVFWKTNVKMQVNDLSSQNGGHLSPHASHQRGLDADVPLMCVDGSRHYSCNKQSKFDPETSWFFVKALASKTSVQRIFLRQAMIDKMRQYANAHESNYQLRQAIFSSLLAADENHYSHFHLRFHCSAEDIAAGCVEQKGGFRGTGTIDPLIDSEDNENTEPPEISSAEGSESVSFNDEQLLAKAAADPNKCLYFEPDLNPIIAHCSQKYGIDDHLIRAIIVAESGGGCDKQGGKPIDVSSADARGLMQLKKISMEESNKFRPPSEQLVWPRDAERPSTNICAGTQSLARAWSRYRSTYPTLIRTTEDVLTAYNFGIGNMRDGIPVPPATLAYIEKIKRYYNEISGGLAFKSDSPALPGVTVTGQSLLVS
ncbi:MAG: penicillin-insensitive murein endopeptidase [Candidatus Micrarchaeota archaeon]|nr:penicillin-insensitive murein endopeptidase [Candidatus Micrarchaeota archaeon]